MGARPEFLLRLTFSFDVVGVANDSGLGHFRVARLHRTEAKRQNMWEGEHLTPQMTAPAGRTWPVLTIASSTSAVPSLWPLMLMTSSIRPVIW